MDQHTNVYLSEWLAASSDVTYTKYVRYWIQFCTFYQFPAIQAWNKNVMGVSPSSISPTIFANFWEWKTIGTTAASATSTPTG